MTTILAVVFFILKSNQKQSFWILDLLENPLLICVLSRYDVLESITDIVSLHHPCSLPDLDLRFENNKIKNCNITECFCKKLQPHN